MKDVCMYVFSGDLYDCQYEDLMPIERRRSWVFLTKFIFIDNLY